MDGEAGAFAGSSDSARNRDILTSTSSLAPLVCSAVLPLTYGTSSFVSTNPVSGAFYVVEDNGTVRTVGG
jgi:hypothetical protein